MAYNKTNLETIGGKSWWRIPNRIYFNSEVIEELLKDAGIDFYAHFELLTGKFWYDLHFGRFFSKGIELDNQHKIEQAIKIKIDTMKS